MRVLVLCLLSCWICAAEPSVEVVGLRVVAPGIGKDKQELRPFNWSPGTTVAVRVSHPDGGLLGCDKDASKLQLFTDDKGTDLTRAMEGVQNWNNSSFGGFPAISKDGKALLLEINGSSLPLAGAQSLQAQGTIALSCASKFDTETVHNVSLTVNSVLKGKQLAYTITKTGKPDWGDAALQVSFKTTDDVSLVKSIVFKKPGGEPIDARQGMSSRMGFAGKYTTEVAYNFPEKIEAVDVVIETWTDKRTVMVPFDIQVDVGLR